MATGSMPPAHRPPAGFFNSVFCDGHAAAQAGAAAGPAAFPVLDGRGQPGLVAEWTRLRMPTGRLALPT
jgi:prepilin-type processing-associated H-X9-DG protein